MFVQVYVWLNVYHETVTRRKTSESTTLRVPLAYNFTEIARKSKTINKQGKTTLGRIFVDSWSREVHIIVNEWKDLELLCSKYPSFTSNSSSPLQLIFFFTKLTSPHAYS